jgi:hypothetical protein
VITSVRRGTPGIDAGLNVDDEIIAIDDVRVRADGLAARLESIHVRRQEIALLVALREAADEDPDLTLGAEPGRTWRLGIIAERDPEQTAPQRADGRYNVDYRFSSVGSAAPNFRSLSSWIAHLEPCLWRIRLEYQPFVFRIRLLGAYEVLVAPFLGSFLSPPHSLGH